MDITSSFPLQIQRSANRKTIAIRVYPDASVKIYVPIGVSANKINEVVAKCTLDDSKKIPEVNGTFDGYNAFVDLRSDSYANITSIGKSMLSPYVSYPIPS